MVESVLPFECIENECPKQECPRDAEGPKTRGLAAAGRPRSPTGRVDLAINPPYGIDQQAKTGCSAWGRFPGRWWSASDRWIFPAPNRGVGSVAKLAGDAIAQGPIFPTGTGTDVEADQGPRAISPPCVGNDPDAGQVAGQQPYQDHQRPLIQGAQTPWKGPVGPKISGQQRLSPGSR
jgi:hypothetical protein